jgi:transcriptional regulator with XRE-family HTH domain
MKGEVLAAEYVGEVLFRLRHKAGLTQKELAEKAMIHPTSISKYESGESPLGKRNLKKICEALGYSPKQFMADTWDLSEEEASPSEALKSDPAPAFPLAELEQIYEESALEGKNLYLRTCRALFDALCKASGRR